MCHTHRPFFSSVSSICKWYSVDLNGGPICAQLWRSFDITTLLIYCQLLIGTAPASVRLLSSVCCASRNPEAKTLPVVSAYYHKYIILLTAVKERLLAAHRKIRCSILFEQLHSPTGFHWENVLFHNFSRKKYFSAINVNNYDKQIKIFSKDGLI